MDSKCWISSTAAFQGVGKCRDAETGGRCEEIKVIRGCHPLQSPLSPRKTLTNDVHDVWYPGLIMGTARDINTPCHTIASTAPDITPQSGSNKLFSVRYLPFSQTRQKSSYKTHQKMIIFRNIPIWHRRQTSAVLQILHHSRAWLTLKRRPGLGLTRKYLEE